MRFQYEARSNVGEVQRGVVEAPSYEAAVETLQTHQLLVVGLQQEAKGFSLHAEIKFFARVKKQEIVLFSRQLAVLFDAQVPLLVSLRSLAEQSRNPRFKKIILGIGEEVNAGVAFSAALSRYPKLFSNFYVSVVRAGEASGRLQEVLEYLADHEEKNYDLNRKVRGALIYPIFIICAIVLVGAIMMIFVVPKLTAIFEESNVQLPILTRIVISISNVLQAYWWVFLAAFVAAVVGLIKYVHTPRGRQMWDIFLLHIPIFKNLFQKIYLARFAENLSTLIKGGIPIIQALGITASVVGNEVYRVTIEEAARDVEKGGKISEALRRNKYVPVLVTQMVAVGEETGKLDSILLKVATFYQKDVDALVDNLTELIQPVLILILGAATGILVAAILLPIYNLGSSI
jgi:type II secretory pathway component PulF